jgi:hypothetical protein
VDQVWNALGALVACALSIIAATADWLVKIAPALAWPLAALVIIGWFRKEIRELIPKLIRWKLGPLEGEIGQQPTTPVPTEKLTAPAKVLVDQAVEGSPDLAMLEKQFDAELPMYKDEAQIPLLLRRLAEARVAGFYEWLHNLIFGSQLVGLAKLADSGGTVSRDEAIAFFEEYRSKYPVVHQHGFDAWLAFLERNSLVIWGGEDKSTLKLTDRGRAFLRFAAARHAGQFKPF